MALRRSWSATQLLPMLLLAIGVLVSGKLDDCRITSESIKSRGYFVFTGGAPPYDFKCWLLKARYHVAPACETDPPLWAFRWTMRGCEHQSFEASPLSFLPPDYNPADHQGRPFTVLMYGHSFLRQLFESAACKFEHLVVGGSFDGFEPPVTVDQVRRNSGVCPGYCAKDLTTKFPPSTHGGLTYQPHLNFDCCQDSGACVEFGENRTAAGRVRLCYQYQFGSSFPRVRQMVQKDDVDVVICTTSQRAMAEVLHKRFGSPVQQAIIPMAPMQALANQQLMAAMNEKNPTLSRLVRKFNKARPQACDRFDVHFAMPGVPDFTMHLIYLLARQQANLANLTMGVDSTHQIAGLEEMGPLERLTPTGIGIGRRRRRPR